MASDVRLTRVVSIVLISTLIPGGAARSLGYKEITWLSTPGKFIDCMEQTDVVFNWTHSSVPHPVNIAWYYLGSADNRKLNYILGFSNNQTYIPNSDFAKRVKYVNFPGSAAMILMNVTSVDDGLFEAKVAVLDPEFYHNVPYISNITTLNIISEIDIAMTITIGNEVFYLSLAQNGTHVTLPDTVMTSYTVLEVIAAVSSFAPQPSHIIIRFQKQGYTHSCTQAYICPSGVDFDETKTVFLRTDIAITITFDTQNLLPFHIMGRVKPAYEIDITISIEGMRFDLSVAENGTRVKLPDIEMTSHTVLEVSVNVSQAAPQPNNITISIEPGGGSYSCADVYNCNSRLAVAVNKDPIQQADLAITINFDTIDLPPVLIFGIIAQVWRPQIHRRDPLHVLSIQSMKLKTIW